MTSSVPIIIFVTNAEGHAIYVSPEWEDLTGHSLAQTRDFGWTEAVHPEDRETVRRIVAEAIRTQQAFNVRYRLLCRDGRRLWLASGAVPSFGPPDRTFLGFLGSLTNLGEAADGDAPASGSLGGFVPPLQPGAMSPRNDLEQLADHLIALHVLMKQVGGRQSMGILEAALFQIGQELARDQGLGSGPRAAPGREAKPGLDAEPGPTTRH